VACIAASLVAGTAIAATTPYSFRREDHHFTFAYEFTVAAQPDEILAVLYPVPNLRQYSRSGGSVDLIDEGPGWQLVRLTHETLLWTFSAVVRREIDCDGHCIRFRMLSAQRTGIPIPMPNSSEGEYRFEPAGGGVRITFIQRGDVPHTPLAGLWTSWVKSQAVTFSRDLEAYVRSSIH